MKNPFQPWAVRALARRTLLSAFQTPVAPAALFVFYLACGYLFALPLLLEGQATVRGLLDAAPLLLTLLVPALTMGLLAEELRAGTFETLATCPLEDWDIVLGKFLGFAALHALLVAGLLIYPLALSVVAAPPGLDWGETAGVLCALLLQGWLYGAIGLFASSLTRSQAAAYLAGFALCFAPFACGKAAALLPGPLASAAEVLGLDAHVSALARGVFDLRDLLYFASGAAAFLLLAAARLEARRWRRGRLLSAAGVAAVAAALLALNLLAPLLRARADLSADRAYSLSPSTRDALRRLDGPLVARVYFSRRLPPPFSSHERFLRDMLAEYRRAAGGKVRVDWVDPEGDDAAKKQALEAGVTPVQINVTGSGRFEAKEAWMGLVLLYGGKAQTLPVLEGPRDLEYALTRRVRKLLGDRRRVVGFVTGHGEKAPGDRQLAGFFAAADDLVETRAVTLDKLPAELDALWLAGPVKKLTAAELDALRAFAKTGKVLGVLADTRLADFVKFQASPLDAGLAPLLASWGLSQTQAFVVDAQCERIQMQTPMGRYTAVRVADYPFIPVATNLPAHPATTGLSSAPLPFAHALRFDPKSGAKWTPLARSTHRSWLADTGSVAPDASLERLSKGEAGPFDLAGVAEGPAGKLLVVGTSYQLDPRLADKPAIAAFVLDLLEWSAGDASLLALRGKGLAYRPLRPLDAAGAAAARWLLIVSLPSCVVGAALYAHELRRRRLLALPAAYADL